jgi:ketosteroid isomerase-like protein
MNDLINKLINAADIAIKEERFDDLMEFYTDDAVLIVKPGLEVQGKEAIKKAFVKIAAYFKNSLIPTQGKNAYDRGWRYSAGYVSSPAGV